MDKLSTYIQLDALYSSVPEVDCKGKCHRSCGPIACGAAEWARVREHVGKVGALVGIDCPVLVDGRCAAYSVRPLICRLWGAVKEMRCPYGCRPKRWLSDAEAHELIRRVMIACGGKIGGPGAGEGLLLELSAVFAPQTDRNEPLGS